MTPPSGVRPVFLALVGATASGKTALSVAVARRLDGEIVSMDSRQVYRGMDVGTAKATAGERGGVPHHGLDLVSPDQRYSAGRFARDARGWIREIRERGRVPLLVGGTGFFLKAVVDPIFAEPPLDGERRDRLRRYFRDQPRQRLEAWAAHLDPERAALAAQGGPHRLSRTLEVALLTGRPLSWWHRAAPPDGEATPGLVVELRLPRDELDRRILARARAMVEGGLVDEVKGLVARGYGPGDPGMTGTGYREVLRYLEGEGTVEDMVEEIAAATRRYARRQLTWFRTQLPPTASVLDATLPLDEQVKKTVSMWTSANEELR